MEALKLPQFQKELHFQQSLFLYKTQEQPNHQGEPQQDNQ